MHTYEFGKNSTNVIFISNLYMLTLLNVGEK
jgi:hypothetical protein